MKTKILIKGILFNIFVAIFTCFIYTSCNTSDVPVVSTNTIHVVYGYNNYGYHRRQLPPPPRIPIYVCPPSRDPYHPVWVQHPIYKPKTDIFGDMRKDIKVPSRVDNRHIYSKNKNFGGRR